MPPHLFVYKILFGFQILMIAVRTDAKFYPVDLSLFVQNGQPDPYRTGDQEYFRQWLKEWVDPYTLKVINAGSLTYWDYETNITNENAEATLQTTDLGANFTLILANMAKRFDSSKIVDDQLKRIHKYLTELGDAALPSDELTELTSIVLDMSNVFSTATICFDPAMSVQDLQSLSASGCPENLQVVYEPTLYDYMLKVWDEPEKRKYVWKAWRDASGGVLRANYTRYIDLKNKAARLNGFADNGQLWRASYVVESINYTDAVFLADMEGLWQQLRPLYLQLHAYVRRKLIQKFPSENLSPTGPIPAHMIGDIMSQVWVGMLSFTQLFPSLPLLDVTDEMIAQNYTVDEMFRLSEKFQVDLGLMPMVESFWNLSLLTRPTDRDVVCHASAWDFYTNPPADTRIKMCTQVDMDDFIVIHHEMGHIQYFLQYANQEPAFRDGANSGFHEAVGDTLSLSVATPKHLAGLGLLKNNIQSEESDLNYQFSIALDKIAFLPFIYLMDKYRYDVFSGSISKENLNAGWWKYLLDYQGIVPPVPRSEDDFDPGAKYHIDADVEFMRYFISYILQFQFHKALCKAAGHTGPLYQCDIDGSKAAGKLLSDMLSLGSSKPWPIALEQITGSRKMDASAMLEFFDPLYKYLQVANAKNNEFIGWK